MAIPHALPGLPVDLRPAAKVPSEARTIALAKNDALQAIRLVIPEGHEVARPQAAGMIASRCLEGWIAFTARGDIRGLRAGYWLFQESIEPPLPRRARRLLGGPDHRFPRERPRPG